ncbi:hypothetical protein [Streptomyces sp. ST2-7A]|uniref:hypothetical protein n=1 Tax=Streptomyces sp. ST2-7A TaxID=2907214 RepID=UPI001F1C3FD5|nr:hypothetical protein [Streptomyces sp. ST2-7A]MCE7081952.1 hypothetical protein [Streptomyces sp. ST2-7A]
MTPSPEEPRARAAELRAVLRDAIRSRDRALAARARRELRTIEAARAAATGGATGARGERGGIDRTTADRPLPPARDRVRRALVLLGAPAAPKLLSTVHEAFFGEPLIPSRIASLRRDEERSFAAKGPARAPYVCAALTHDRFAPVRGLLALSDRPLEYRVIGPLGPRVDHLTHIRNLAVRVREIRAAGDAESPAAAGLLRRFALTVPGSHRIGDGPAPDPDLDLLIRAVEAEALVHRDADDRHRRAAAARARAQLPFERQLFGATPLQVIRPVTDLT